MYAVDLQAVEVYKVSIPGLPTALGNMVACFSHLLLIKNKKGICIL